MLAVTAVAVGEIGGSGTSGGVRTNIGSEGMLEPKTLRAHSRTWYHVAGRTNAVAASPTHASHASRQSGTVDVRSKVADSSAS
jgi:hypothetical protein